MALSRVNQELSELKPDISSLMSPKIQDSVMAYYDDLNPRSEYMKDVSKIVKQAQIYLKSCVDERKKLDNKDKLAIVLDIDDTSVSNYPSIVKDNFKNTPDEIIRRYRLANQPVIQPVLRFSKKAINKGVSVFFITHRKPHDDNPRESLRPYTVSALESAGYKGWRGLYIPIGKEKKLTSTNFKIKKRKTIAKQGYRIILNMGDQTSDLEGGFAERTFKLPNYLYPTIGLPANSHSLPEEKKSSLDTMKFDEIVSDSEMASSAFGHGCDTAKRLKLGSFSIFKQPERVIETTLCCKLSYRQKGL